MTRRELQPFENQVIQFDGWVESWTELPDGAKDVLIKTVKIRPYHLEENDQQRNDRPPTVTDHSWLRVPKNAGYKAMHRLDRVFGYARVGWYTRANQTVDLGLSAIQAVPGGEIANQIKESLRNGNWASAYSHLATISRRIKEADLAVFDPDSSPLVIAHDLQDRFLPLIEKNKAAVATTKRNGRCKSASSFADLLA